MSPPSLTPQGTVPAQKRGSFRVFKSSSQSEWLATSLLAAKTITAGAECLPFPYVRGAFGMVSTLLETVQKVQKNREDLRGLCKDAVEIIKIIQDQISCYGSVRPTGDLPDMVHQRLSLRDIVIYHARDELSHQTAGSPARPLLPRHLLARGCAARLS
ncbi:hypothetical protein B0H14DRAFT_2713574 [Mycena olivaceomarginata]|nr:hypothetical protein B0H14DRAFT_2713574 [Mycena olivaceomarginata]